VAQCILAIDQGTTGSTALVVSSQGKILSKVNKEFRQIFPKPGWVEHDPDEIWQSVLTAMTEAMALAKVSGEHIAAIGITNQRETVVHWDPDTGQKLYNAIVWQCRRTAPDCLKLKKAGLESKIKNKTGLVLDPYFSGTKIKWLVDNVKSKKGIFGNIDSYLVWRLSSGSAYVTDVSNASRTMIMNLQTGEWDKDLLKLFKVKAENLPTIVDSSGIVGKVKGIPGLLDGTPIAGIAGDQQSALFGQLGLKTGDSKCTYGTGSFILLNTGNKLVRSKHGLLTTVAWRLKGEKKLTYALEGGAFICGAAVQFLRDQLGFVKTSSEIEDLARSVNDSEGVEFVPALTGMGAPYWMPDARGKILGLTRGTSRAHIARATLEAMALQNVDILEAMQKDSKVKIKTLRVDGGASANNLLMQFQADFLGSQILRPKAIETTSLGAAYLAGLGVGLWKDTKELQHLSETDRTFEKNISSSARALRLKKWRHAVLAGE
jgi:glycerol kinase